MKVCMVAIVATLVMMWSAAAISGTADGKDSTVPAQSTDVTAEKPGAMLPELKYEFDPVVDGAQVTHDFPIRNTGDGPLAITRVKTG